MKPETVQNLLDRINKQGVAAYAEAVKDEPERSALNEGFEMGVVWAQDRYAPVLNATVYRSCPECGGSQHVIDHVAVEGADTPYPSAGGPEYVPCPACADAPVAIVETSLRRRAKDALWVLEDTADLMPAEAWLDAAVDAVLSVVLGHVRYAKEILYNAHTDTDGNACPTVEYFINDDPCDYKGFRTGGGLSGDIAILEDVDSTDTSATHVESAGANRQEAGKEE